MPKKSKKTNPVIKLINKFRKKGPQVNVLRFSGIIGDFTLLKKGLTAEALEDDIKKAFKCGKPKAVGIVINSPGGSPVQSEYIYQMARRISEEEKVPVYTFAEDVAASGGYWLACIGEEFYVSGSTLTGSIGVISSGFGYVDAMKKLGVERRVYKEGENKSILDPYLPEDAASVKILTDAMRDVHEDFKNMVRERRKGKINKKDEKELFSGAFWSGRKAVELGLADGIDDVWNFMRKKYGKDVRFKHISKPKGLLKRVFSSLSPEAMVDRVAAILIERGYWSRFGM